MKKLEIEIYSYYNKIIRTTKNVTTPKLKSVETSWSELSEKYDNFVFDGFGTLYLANTVYDYSIALINKLRKANKKLRVLTNAASRSSQKLAAHLNTLSLEFAPDEIISSGSLIPDALLKQKISKAFLVGPQSAKYFLQQAQCQSAEVGDLDFSGNPQQSPVVILTSSLDDDAPERQWATKLLQIPGCILIIANPDVMAPSPSGKYFVSGSLGYEWEQKYRCKTTYLGKPFAEIYHKLKASLPGGKTLVIGDTIGTDILGGKTQGLDTALILNGNSAQSAWVENSKILNTAPHWIIKP